eukprot:34343_1
MQRKKKKNQSTCDELSCEEESEESEESDELSSKDESEEYDELSSEEESDEPDELPGCIKTVKCCQECSEFYQSRDLTDCCSSGCTNVIGECSCYEEVEIDRRCKMCSGLLCKDCGNENGCCLGCYDEFERINEHEDDAGFAYH